MVDGVRVRPSCRVYVSVAIVAAMVAARSLSPCPLSRRACFPGAVSLSPSLSRVSLWARCAVAGCGVAACPPRVRPPSRLPRLHPLHKVFSGEHFCPVSGCDGVTSLIF